MRPRPSLNALLVIVFVLGFLLVNYLYRSDVQLNIQTDVKFRIDDESRLARASVQEPLTHSAADVGVIGPQGYYPDQVTETLNRQPERIKQCQDCSLCPSGKVVDCVTAIISTHGRLDNVRAQIESMERVGYGAMRVIVVNDHLADEDIYKEAESWLKSVENVAVEYYFYDGVWLGIGRGRNAALIYVKTPYFLQLDDDFLFLETTKLEQFVEVLSSTDAAIVGGRREGVPQFYGMLRVRPEGIIVVVRCSYSELYKDKTWDVRLWDGDVCKQSDHVINFFMGKTEAVRGFGGWDPAQKYNEHIDFFIRVKRAGLKVAYCGNVLIGHRHTEYPKDLTHRYNEKSRAYLNSFMGHYNFTQYAVCLCPFFEDDQGTCSKYGWRYKFMPEQRVPNIQL